MTEEFHKPELPPFVLAAADQELAAVGDLLDTLIDQWRHRQRQFDRNDFDRLGRISCFMMADVLPLAAPRGILAALAVAIVRLSELES